MLQVALQGIQNRTGGNYVKDRKNLFDAARSTTEARPKDIQSSVMPSASASNHLDGRERNFLALQGACELLNRSDAPEIVL